MDAIKESEPRYESLICTIQQREGSKGVPRDEREAASIELIGLFKYLIKKIANLTWRKECGETRTDWEHDTMATFFELVISDFLPKKFGGAASFGPYIQQKLYWKMVYKGQKLCNSNNRLTSVCDFEIENVEDISGARMLHGTRYAQVLNPFTSAIREAILANATGLEESYIESLRDQDIDKILAEIDQIVSTLDDRSIFVWRSYFYSDMSTKLIGESLVPPVGSSRVHQFVHKTRKTVLEELGKRRVSASLLE